jgi:hypothetical protein
VNDLIGRVADKWTMLVLEIMVERGELRFTRLGELVPGISQKDAYPDSSRHGARRTREAHRPSCRYAKGRIYSYGTRNEPKRRLP